MRCLVRSILPCSCSCSCCCGLDFQQRWIYHDCSLLFIYFIHASIFHVCSLRNTTRHNCPQCLPCGALTSKPSLSPSACCSAKRLLVPRLMVIPYVVSVVVTRPPPDVVMWCMMWSYILYICRWKKLISAVETPPFFWRTSGWDKPGAGGSRRCAGASWMRARILQQGKPDDPSSSENPPPPPPRPTS